MSKRIERGGQNVHYKHVYFHESGHTVRIRICSNAYKFQSHACGEVWSAKDLKWNLVASIESGSMKTQEGLYIKKIVSDKDFEHDHNALIKLVDEVLLGK